jgi:hypothetical protein
LFRSRFRPVRISYCSSLIRADQGVLLKDFTRFANAHFWLDVLISFLCLHVGDEAIPAQWDRLYVLCFFAVFPKRLPQLGYHACHRVLGDEGICLEHPEGLKLDAHVIELLNERLPVHRQKLTHGRESDAVHQRHETRVGAIAVPPGFDIEMDDEKIAIFDCLLQPRERLLLLAQPGIEHGY